MEQQEISTVKPKTPNGEREPGKRVDRRVRRENLEEQWDSTRDIYFVLLRLFFESNPLGIAGTSNKDEYRHEVDLVLGSLPTTTSAQDTVRAVRNAFVESFNENIAGPLERYQELGKAVWEAWRHSRDLGPGNTDTSADRIALEEAESGQETHPKTRIDPTIGRKGRLVEKIVQWLYEGVPNALIVPREFLLNTQGTREWEIDILITFDIKGAKVRVAVECKNEQKPIGKTYMQHFVNKLNAVGIPTSLGLFVSSSRYTSEALKIARKAGVKPLLVDNLTADRLASQVEEVIQSLIFFQATVDAMFMADESTDPFKSPEEYRLYDERDRYAGMLLDQVWFGWINGGISTQLGKHIVQIDIPKGWYRVGSNRKYEIQAASAVIQVSSLFLDIIGWRMGHSARDANDGRIERLRQESAFELTSGDHVLQTLATQLELEQYLDKKQPAVVSYRKMPRIRYGPVYWPPSDRVIHTLREHMGPFELGVMPQLFMGQFEDLEGADVLRAWEPIADEYFSDQTGGNAPRSQVRFHDFVAPADT
jgi:Restriction endonuclease